MDRLDELDVFYLSYDEPDAEAHWADLLNKVPWAKRVHGVKGFDAAHKECARQSATRHFITVDGDNYVDPDFFGQALHLEDGRVYSWPARNVINDLVYGNGGLKVWSRDFVLNMRTHEIGETDTAKVDFCWETNYVHMKGVYNTSHPNASPDQAFRAGFREGVKMCLNDGKRVPVAEFETLPHINRMRLAIWCSVGADVENGKWAMMGARTGAWMIMFKTNWNYTWINDYSSSSFSPRWYDTSSATFTALFKQYGDALRGIGLNVADLDEHGSRFYKLVDAPSRDKLIRQ